MNTKTFTLFIAIACFCLAVLTPDWKKELVALAPTYEGAIVPPLFYGECGDIECAKSDFCMPKICLEGTYKGASIKEMNLQK